MRSLCLALLIALTVSGQPRPITLDDMHRLKTVGDPRCSPDAKWIAYTLSTVDVVGDKRDTDVWMASVDGKENLRVTTSTEAESSPKWSPDGKYLSFLSSRTGKAKGSQVWVIDRRGGEAQQFTEMKGRLSYYEWSPDATKLALVIREEDDDKKDEKKPEGTAPAEKPKPIVIDRYAFKRDGTGYISGAKRNRIYLYDIATRKSELVTTENFDETAPVWSPDGQLLAFTSNRAADGDRVPNNDVWVVEAKAGSVARKLTVFTGSDTQPVWSPDGKMIAYLTGSEHKMGEYNMNRLAIVPVDGGAPVILTAKLDRGVTGHQFTADGKQLEFLVSDDMSLYPARVSLTGAGAVERMVGGKLAMTSIDRAGTCVAALVSNDLMPAELHVLEGSTLKKLTAHNEEVLKGLQLVTPEEVSFKGSDGSEAHGLLFKPVNYVAGTKVPFLLRIHGGPNGQDQHAFRMEEQLFAAAGYGILNVNYRGSSGRGQQYTVSIASDWGHKEVIDLHAGIDHVVKMGLADPDKLGVGGWSYGGILTNYLIASDTRFKAAISGAGVAFPLAFYGHDQYIRQYDHEIGPPWEKKGLEPWLKISYPFLHADRIKTPTMFLGGDKDFNVPLLGSEQMYQALRNVGTESQLIIYPGENHGIARPSFQRDRMQRYLDWYAKFLKPAPAATSTSISAGK